MVGGAEVGDALGESERLQPLTCWSYRAAPGLVPLREFYADLGRRTFNSTQYLRHPSQPLYTPEPDIIHEVVGHANQLASPRFAGIRRVHSAREVAEQRGTIRPDYAVARGAAEAFYARMRQLFDQGKCITTFGPYSPGQAVAMKRMGIEGIYLGGWATSAKGSAHEEPGPDLASYPLSQVPDEAAPIVRALLTEAAGGRAYWLADARPYPMTEVVDTVRAALRAEGYDVTDRRPPRLPAAAGALAARMTGGGFGGSAIAIVPSSGVEDISSAVEKAFSAKGFREPELFPVSADGPARRER